MDEITCTILGCNTTKIMAKGWCNAHYKRWYRHGDPLAAINRRAPDGSTPEQRLNYVGYTERLVHAELGPCWEWNGLLDKGGYGRVWDGERVQAAHRLAYMTWIGPLSPSLHACHRCDNRICINPAHLFPGDDTTNMADMVTKNRSDNGERRWSHKLTDAQVDEIRAAYTGERGQQTRLAEQYGVRQSHINGIVRGRSRTKTTNWEALNDDAELGGACSTEV